MKELVFFFVVVLFKIKGTHLQESHSILFIYCNRLLHKVFLLRPFQTRFDFTNQSHAHSTDCSGDSFVVTFSDVERAQDITLSFTKDNSSYALTNVKIVFTALNTTFPNITSKIRLKRCSLSAVKVRLL